MSFTELSLIAPTLGDVQPCFLQNPMVTLVAVHVDFPGPFPFPFPVLYAVTSPRNTGQFQRTSSLVRCLRFVLLFYSASYTLCFFFYDLSIIVYFLRQVFINCNCHHNVFATASTSVRDSIISAFFNSTPRIQSTLSSISSQPPTTSITNRSPPTSTQRQLPRLRARRCEGKSSQIQWLPCVLKMDGLRQCVLHSKAICHTEHARPASNAG